MTKAKHPPSRARLRNPRSRAPDSPWQDLIADPEVGIATICERIVGCQSLTAIARDYSISRSKVCEWIAADPDRAARARAARITSAAAWDELALAGIDEAADAFELAKAKERAHHLRWRASKIAPGDYGDRLEVDQRTTIQSLTDEQIHAELDRIAAKLADLTGGTPDSTPA